MGNATTKQDTRILSNSNRVIFINFKHIITSTTSAFSRYVVFVYVVRYQRYVWEIEVRFSTIDNLNSILTSKFESEMISIQRPERYRLKSKTDAVLAERALSICKYIQELCDNKLIFHHPNLRELLNINACSLNPDMGRKGREGWLQKSSGGYLEKFSRKFGDYIDVWNYRWIVLHDTCLAWYKSPHHKDPLGSLQIDAHFIVSNKGRVISITTQTRKLLLYADTPRNAMNWVTDLVAFYNSSSRVNTHFFEARFPPRRQCDVKVYTLTREYYSALAITLLSAQKEILITGWKNSPTVILSRPPYPTLRLDQILKYKAEQGIKIHMLLYKEVEGIGQTNDSSGAKLYLESLHSNIRVIRHPNKFVGGSTAMLWSHHEKVVVVDRSVCFVGGVDISFTRWDDELKRLNDEDGLIYPGHDYKNPAPGLFKPLRTETINQDPNNLDSDDELVEVEVAVTGVGEGLPQAVSMINDVDDIDAEPMEVEVLVDFGVKRTPSTVQFASNPTSNSLAYNSIANTNISRTLMFSKDVNTTNHNHSNQHHQHQVTAADDDDDHREELAYASEKNLPETAEEKQMKLDTIKEFQDIGFTERFDDSEKFYSSSTIRSKASEQSNLSISSSTTKRKTIFDSITNVIMNAALPGTNKVTTKKINALEPRDLHPRMPWHDVQCSISGLVARDIASHFVQRWNHHRLSVSQHQDTPMYDITDDPDFGKCARCEYPNISECIATCPRCGYDLGPTSSFFTPRNPDYYPVNPSVHSYITFECTYPGRLKLPIQLEGDCPVVVTSILHVTGDSTTTTTVVDNADVQSYATTTKTESMLPSNKSALDNLLNIKNQNTFISSSSSCESSNRALINSNTTTATANTFSSQTNKQYKNQFVALEKLQGEIIHTFGSHAEFLKSLGKQPMIGDVLVAVDDTTVTHLNSNQLKRLIKKKRKAIKSHFASLVLPELHEDVNIKVTFRRHFLQELQGVQMIEKLVVHDSNHPSSMNNNIQESARSNSLYHNNLPNRPMKTEEVTQIEENDAISSNLALDTSENFISNSNTINNIDTLEVMDEQSIQIAVPPITIQTTHTPMSLEDTERFAAMVAASDAAKNKVILNNYKVREFHPACEAAAKQEVQYHMSELYHNYKHYFDVPSIEWIRNGTCKVQLLRSIGKWSTGTKTECSILNCYIETIQKSKHFIYIENQFFVGNTAGEGVLNQIPTALVDRILLAHSLKQAYKVIILIPIHPNGDFSHALKAKVVMHYEYATINRGLHSMFTQLSMKAPNINIRDYIEFYSLRNWGIINNKVITEQIYVHDKLLIADDRVLIIGSANINDRSMLGYRDSELAVRIEDTAHFDIKINGSPFTVGKLPHSIRIKLMKQHIQADDNFDISDLFDKNIMNQWRSISTNNTMLYDKLDGDISIYKCTTINQFKNAFNDFNHPSYLDPIIKDTVHNIKGYLVDWPQHFFSKEDLSPSLATRTLIPNELWV